MRIKSGTVKGVGGRHDEVAQDGFNYDIKTGKGEKGKEISVVYLNFRPIRKQDQEEGSLG